MQVGKAAGWSIVLQHFGCWRQMDIISRERLQGRISIMHSSAPFNFAQPLVFSSSSSSFFHGFAIDESMYVWPLLSRSIYAHV